MAVPKGRKTAAARDARRAQHKIGRPAVSVCPQCHEPKLPHRVCPSCGYYDGKEVVEVE
ncbi:MAG: 50S ribosomal protein L32 [Coriobacteriia bacterium]